MRNPSISTTRAASILLFLAAVCAGPSTAFSVSRVSVASTTPLFSHSPQGNEDDDAIRLNKVFKATHSRREADALIQSGRVSVNGKPVDSKGGFKVRPFVDRVELDGITIKGWEAMNGIQGGRPKKKGTDVQKSSKQKSSKQQQQFRIATQNFEYIKYWKPRGVTCTTDQNIRSNIIDDLIQRRGYRPKHRVYPVGRLDKDTSGLILLTSDGRLPNSALRGQFKQPKIYQVIVDQPIHHSDLQLLRKGVVITTTAQRDGRDKSLTAPTLPCEVKRLPKTRDRGVTMTLVEGRNRQIRKMMQALGYKVVELHRIQFMGVTLNPLSRAGDWIDLGPREMKMVKQVLEKAAASAEASVKR